MVKLCEYSYNSGSATKLTCNRTCTRKGVAEKSPKIGKVEGRKKRRKKDTSIDVREAIERLGSKKSFI